jgi:DNA-binding MarR family transcriptional regulator
MSWNVSFAVAMALPLSWYDVLVQLSEAPGNALRMRELADAVLLSKSGLTRLVDRMEQAGLVERREHDRRRTRRPCRTDRRGHGQRLRDAAPTHIQGVREHFVGLLDDDEIQVLAEPH